MERWTSRESKIKVMIQLIDKHSSSNNILVRKIYVSNVGGCPEVKERTNTLLSLTVVISQSYVRSPVLP